MKQMSTQTRQTIFPAVRYTHARAAIDWLQRAFGATEHLVHDNPDGTVAHAELLIAGNLIMLGESNADGDYPVRSPKQVNAVTASFYVVLPNDAAVDALHERARTAGATITHAPYDTDYGSHDFSAFDLDGHPWTFGTYDPLVD
jgi:uncharacterized glyoxalase superfamily protein PhnB